MQVLRNLNFKKMHILLLRLFKVHWALQILRGFSLKSLIIYSYGLSLLFKVPWVLHFLGKLSLKNGIIYSYGSNLKFVGPCRFYEGFV